MDLAMALVRGLYALNALVILSCGCLFCLKRFLWRRRKRLGKHNLGFYPTYTSAGNALQALQAITQPRAQHVLEEKFEDEADDDDEGEPVDPERHLHRQLRRIRRGEKIERLTALRRDDYGDSTPNAATQSVSNPHIVSPTQSS
jgi:hypothetical protein